MNVTGEFIIRVVGEGFRFLIEETPEISVSQLLSEIEKINPGAAATARAWANAEIIKSAWAQAECLVEKSYFRETEMFFIHNQSWFGNRLDKVMDFVGAVDISRTDSPAGSLGGWDTAGGYDVMFVVGDVPAYNIIDIIEGRGTPDDDLCRALAPVLGLKFYLPQ